MGYYEVLEVIERLEKDNLEVSPRNIIANMPDSTPRCIRRVLNNMIKDGRLKRRIVYLGNKGKSTVYFLNKQATTEGFINDFFKTITDLIH